MAQEMWRPVAGYEGYYEVSNMGKVRSVDRTIVNKDGNKHHKHGRVLTPSFSRRSKYQVVHLSKNGKAQTRSVHRLVAEAVVDGDAPHMAVDHVNGNTFDNRADNLEWVTQAENNRRAINLGLADPTKFVEYPKRPEFKKMMSDVKRKPVIRNDGEVFESARAAAAALGYERSAVSDHIRGGRKTVGGYTFRYLTPRERERYSI